MTDQPTPPPPPPGHYPPPQPAFGPAPPPVPKKTNKLVVILAIVGGLVALCCVGGIVAMAVGAGSPQENQAADTQDTEPASGSGDSAAPPANSSTQPAPAAPKPAQTKSQENPAPEAPGLNDPVRDGKFEFTVTKVDCSKTQIGNEFLNEKAQGRFCLVSITVKNIGDEAQTFSGSSQKAFDAKGTEYSNDTAAEIYANQDAATFLNEINPGNQAKGTIIFDVPKSTKLTELELHDSPFSGGVRVRLS